MKDLKVYYRTEYPNASPISEGFDKEIEKLARKYGLKWQGSGVEIDTKIRDLHYKKEKKGITYPKGLPDDLPCKEKK